MDVVRRYINAQALVHKLEVKISCNDINLAPDLGGFLATTAAIEAGDGLSFSIGGPPPPNLIAGGLLGRPGGLSNSHGKFEGDGSPTRGDLYEL